MSGTWSRDNVPMRVIAGSRKGHRIEAPKGLATRPTSDRVRENVFNLVQSWVEDAIVLDLFAGSGAMGIEALSRGAGRAVLRFVAADTRTYDLVFCDPPYDEYVDVEPTLARYAPKLLSEDGLLVLETAAKTEPQLPLELRTSRRYGAARITLFHR